MSFTPDPDAIARAQETSVNILETVKKHRTVRRVVLTSSSCAAFYPTVNGSLTVDHSKSLAIRSFPPLLLKLLSRFLE